MMALSEEALKQTGFVLHGAGESIQERPQQSPFHSDME